MMRWLRNLLSPPPPRPRELVFVPYVDADRMLLAGIGWRLAPEEDFNDVIGMVYLERNLPNAGAALERTRSGAPSNEGALPSASAGGEQ